MAEDRLRERIRLLHEKLDAKIREIKGESADIIDASNIIGDNEYLVEREDDPLSRENIEELASSLISNLRFDRHREPVRTRNIIRMTELFIKLDIAKKIDDYADIMIYKAMNISGIGLKEDDFGEIREGKYVQIIAITYEPDKNGKKKAKNISLAYFGKAETLEESKKNEVIEFVLRWRYEKAFQNVEHYKLLLSKLRPIDRLF